MHWFRKVHLEIKPKIVCRTLQNFTSMKKKRLKAKQRAFIDDYYRPPFNGTKSYMKVYGCSYDAARSAAARLMKHNEAVKAYLKLKGDAWDAEWKAKQVERIRKEEAERAAATERYLQRIRR